MRVAVTGATGVIGQGAVRALIDAGHEVVGLARTREKAALLTALGAIPHECNLLDIEDLAEMFHGCEAVVNVATHIPVGYAGARPGAWRVNDRIRSQGVAAIVKAAEGAGVRRVVQESVSCIYADSGEEWIDEGAPLDITATTEPVAVAEAHVHDFDRGPRAGVVLRFGNVIGHDDGTRFQLRAVAHGRPIGMGDPQGWTHVVHTDDLGPAVLAALTAPSGVYNVGAAPVRRTDLIAGYAEAVGVESASFMGPLLRRLAGPRIEPMMRSLRVCSDAFSTHTGWAPTRAEFDAEWLTGVGDPVVVTG